MANWTKMVVSENGSGTGNITLGPVNGYPAIADTLGTGKSFHYVFRAVNNTPIEAGVGVMIDAVTLRRDNVYAKIVDGVYSASDGLTAANIPVGAFLYTADTKEMLMDLVREGLELNYGNVSGNLTVDFTQHCIRANLTADTTINVNADTLPPAGVHHEIILKLTSNNNPALTTPFQAGFMVTLGGGRFFIDGGVTAFPSMRLLGAAGSEMTLRLTNIAGGSNYRVENISKDEVVHNLGVVSGNITLDIRRPWNIGELTGSDTTATINAISPAVGVIEPAHFTIVNNGSALKTISFNSNIMSIAGSTINQIMLPVGYKIDFDIRRNPINSAVSYEVKVGDVNYNQTASGLATTYNPSDKHSLMTLTNSNITAENARTGTAPVTGGASAVRCFGGKSSGKWQLSVICDQAPTAVNQSANTGVAAVYFGISDASLNLGSNVGDTATSYAVWVQVVKNSTTFVWTQGKRSNAANTAFATNIAVVNTIYTILVDLDDNKIWFARDGVVLGGGNPEAGTGQDYNLNASPVYFPALSLSELNPQAGAATANAGLWRLLNEVQDPYENTFPSFSYWKA